MRNEDVSLGIDGLSASYGKVPVLRDVSVSIRKGEIVTLIGGNGAGKSTLMKAICGLVKPTGGKVTLFGEDVTGLAPHNLVTRGLSLVPEGRRLFGPMSVHENLDMGAYARRDSEIAADIEMVLDYFPALKGRLHEPAGALSGGQQQMVAVARALMSKPKILLLDEPTIGLAPAIVDTIAEIVTTIAKSGVDILLVEQNAEVALAIAKYAYILENGVITAEGPSAELAKSEEIQRAYLGI
ncbi:ABC transporter ATP-binding protein [Hoeflea sp. G2-23]|uniref:ABC transporter ATP-binding protein n=1 Tax=Hoeflea algicola TaxID=2983763 RepID=A0ABT3ZCA9_9HYPH|nr:ABC transporter ATP-binding protein [Hoeflea algicola]MCY0149266.1 ABC transporter ATP-binding protein [Hoeflea algicola]